MKPVRRRGSSYDTQEQDRVKRILDNEPVGTHLSIQGGRIYRKRQEEGRAWTCVDEFQDMAVRSETIAVALVSLGRVWSVS